ncbi:MAG TPA: cystathionine beta-synthase [Spirochaetia bacterium]|nr:cystathionine beta-synthase [Spirochaetia bacterium]
MSGVKESILEAIGRTPLVRLQRIGAGLKASFFGKVEYMNPGGSVKDRVAVKMIEAAEKEGLLKPGGVIVEATAGNTGVGLALAAAVKGYRCIFVMPDKMSEDKISLLRAYGAEVVITPTSVRPDSPESYNGVADRLSGEIPGAYRPNQFANPNNPRAHYLSTGPEIWEDSGGKVDVLVAGMGTGGTISGTARFLKEKNPRLVVVGADPEGSILSGDSPRSYKVEGIGEDFIPRTFDRQIVDEMVRVSDRDSFNTARRLAREEGLLAGGSAGTAMAAALVYARRLSEPRRIVVVLPDTGRNYLSKIFSDRWMQENGYWEGNVREKATVRNVLGKKKELPPIVSVSPEDTLQSAIDLFHRFNISQIPVIEGNRSVGSLQEATLLTLVFDGVTPENQHVGPLMGKPLPTIDMDTDISEAYRLLLSGASALIAAENGVPRSVLTRIDLIDFYASRRSA